MKPHQRKQQQLEMKSTIQYPCSTQVMLLRIRETPRTKEQKIDFFKQWNLIKVTYKI